MVTIGFFHRAPLDAESGKKEIILRPDSLANAAPGSLQVQEMSRPLDLSMDWLNNHLYILEEIINPVTTNHNSDTQRFSLDFN